LKKNVFDGYKNLGDKKIHNSFQGFKISKVIYHM